MEHGGVDVDHLALGRADKLVVLHASPLPAGGCRGGAGEEGGAARCFHRRHHVHGRSEGVVRRRGEVRRAVGMPMPMFRLSGINSPAPACDQKLVSPGQRLARRRHRRKAMALPFCSRLSSCTTFIRRGRYVSANQTANGNTDRLEQVFRICAPTKAASPYINMMNQQSQIFRICVPLLLPSL
jgi:hypothetical protein